MARRDASLQATFMPIPVGDATAAMPSRCVIRTARRARDGVTIRNGRDPDRYARIMVLDVP
jgi:hypothetical protein